MEEFFTKLTQFGLQLEESCRELRTTIESPALSSGYHENLRDISIQSKSLLNEVIALEKIPNINHPMLNLVLITKNVYDKIQHEINLLEEQLREFGLEEIFVAKSTIVNEELIEESSNEPLKLNPERNTSPVTKAFKRLSTQTQESPTLESFGLSDHALALLKAGTPEMIKDYGIQLNSNESKKKDMHIQKVTNKIDVTPTPTLEHQQISPIPSFPSDQMPECTQIRPITKEEMTTLGYDIRRQVSMEVIYDINEMVADKHDLPDFPRQAWNEFTYDELLNEIGVGGTAAIDIVLLALITLDRIVSRCSDPDLLKKRYRIL